jgi:hypothetical protein
MGFLRETHLGPASLTFFGLNELLGGRAGTADNHILPKSPNSPASRGRMLELVELSMVDL